MRLRNIPRAEGVIAASPLVIQEPGAHRGGWANLFGNDHPIYIEVGMGKGKFITELAARHPERNYIGIERYTSVLLRAVERIQGRQGQERRQEEQAEMRQEAPQEGQQEVRQEAAQERLQEAEALPGNLRFLCIDAAELPEIFAPEEVKGIYLNFSDPWPKERHARRRLPSREFLARYDQILAKDGKVEFKTDNRGLFEFALEELEPAGWHLEWKTFDLHSNPEWMKDNIMTEYEEKFSAKGNPICKMVISR